LAFYTDIKLAANHLSVTPVLRCGKTAGSGANDAP
jgi:hypothetical protein